MCQTRRGESRLKTASKGEGVNKITRKYLRKGSMKIQVVKMHYDLNWKGGNYMKIEAVKNSDGGCFYKITASERASEFDIKVEDIKESLRIGVR